MINKTQDFWEQEFANIKNLVKCDDIPATIGIQQIRLNEFERCKAQHELEKKEDLKLIELQKKVLVDNRNEIIKLKKEMQELRDKLEKR